MKNFPDDKNITVFGKKNHNILFNNILVTINK
jgi:hypothetical protein